MKRLIFSALVLSAVTANAQVKNGMVGINTDEPRATMHIEPGVSESKGLIIPRITAAQMKTMTNLAHFGADHHAIITYLKEPLPLADRTGKLVDVADPGYYYYDNTTGVQKWKAFGGGAEQDFKALPTSTPGFYNYLTKGGGVGNNGSSLGTGKANIGIGGPSTFYFANSIDMTGDNNIGLGAGTFQFPNGGTLSSNNNIGIGAPVYSLYNGGSMTGGTNIGMGTGVFSLQKTNAQFSGFQNTAIGQSLFNLQNGDLTGYSNISMGNSLYTMQSGDMAGNNNIAMGRDIYTFNKTAGAVFTGVRNTGIGQDIFRLSNGDLTGFNNIGMGLSIYALTSGSMTGRGNIGIGDSHYYLTSGNMEGSSNISIGHGSYAVTNGDITNFANNNIALGSSIYYLGNSSTSTFSGDSNIGIGNTLYYLQSGSLTGGRNIGMGYNAFRLNSGDFSGGDNIGIGSYAMQVSGNISGGDNIGIGTEAMNASGGIVGNYNIALGYHSMSPSGKIAGTDNIAIGYYALRPSGSVDIGSYNIGIGNWALWGDMAKGNANIQLGNYYVGTPVAGELNNVVAIGNGINNLNTYNTDSNVILLGNDSSTNAPKIGMGTYNPQAKLDVNGGVRVGEDSSACTSTNKGTIRFENLTNKFQGCDGSNWINLH